MPDTTHTPLAPPRPAQGQRDTFAQALNDPESAIVRDALTRSCDICEQPKTALCAKRPGWLADLAGRIVHLGRLTPRGRATK